MIIAMAAIILAILIVITFGKETVTFMRDMHISLLKKKRVMMKILCKNEICEFLKWLFSLH